MELPGNKGRPDANSAKMQPADQRSIDVEYCLEPINTSGALYHNVTTYNTTQYIVQWRSNQIAMSTNLMGIISNGNSKCASKTKITKF